MKKFNRIAVYPSVLYGADFIVESLESILPHVDQVFIVMMQRPWGSTAGVRRPLNPPRVYAGSVQRTEWVAWPARFDDTRERVAAMNEPRIEIIEAQKNDPWNRWGYGVNEVVRKHVDTNEVVILDPDCVFKKEEAERAFTNWVSHPEYLWAHVEQVELWRTPAWRIERPQAMVSMHRGDLSLLSSNGRPQPKSHRLIGRVHNFGFCVSEQAMLWKHLTAMAFSPVVGESLPNPDWYEKKWLSWHPATNNRNLEVSIGCEHAITTAIPYEVAQLPVSIKKRYDKGEWPKFEGR